MIITFNKHVSSQGKSDMIMENFYGDVVDITHVEGDVTRCTVMGTQDTPDGDPLVMVDYGDGVGELFACDITMVERIG